VAQAAEVGVEIDDPATAHEHRREHAETRIGPVGAARERERRLRGAGHHRERAGQVSKTPPGRLDHRPRLEEALLELGLRIGPGRDAAAGAEPDAVAAYLERPDGHVQLEPGNRARVADRAGVRLAPARLELGDHAHRLDLRRARDRPGREGCPQELAVAHLRPQRAGDARHEMPHPGSGARRRQLGHVDRAVLAHAPEVVAHEVDDHHVLGPVLDRPGEPQPALVVTRGSSLDRLAQHLAAPAAQEELGRDAADGPPGAGGECGVRGAELARHACEEVGRVPLEAGVEAQAQVCLEDLPGRDPFATRRHGGELPRGAGRRRPERADPHRPFAHAGHEPSRQPLAALPQRRVALLGPERLEPPAPLGIQVQQMVVEGERELRQRHGPRRGGGHGLEPGPESVAEIAEPATADRVVGVVVALHLGLHVENVERVFLSPGDGERLRSHERAAAGPRAGECERPLIPANQQRGTVRGHVALERDPEQAGTAGRAHARRDCTYLSSYRARIGSVRSG
jgi:hypothetical protein